MEEVDDALKAFIVIVVIILVTLCITRWCGGFANIRLFYFTTAVLQIIAAVTFGFFSNKKVGILGAVILLISSITWFAVAAWPLK